MSFFVNDQTREVILTDPDDGSEAKVQIRELSAGDTAAIQDTIRISAGDKSPELRIGDFKLAMLERAIVSWDLPLAVSPQTLRQLKPSVFEKLFESVNDEDEESPLDNKS